MSPTRDDNARSEEGRLPHRTKQLWIFFFGMFVTALVVALLTAVITSADNTTEINDRSKTNTAKISSSDQTLRIIRGCLTPEKRCYERAKAQRIAQDGAHLSAVIAAQFCGDRLLLDNPKGYTHRQIVRCVGTIMDGGDK